MAVSRDAFEGKQPQRRLQQRLDRRLEEVAEAVAGGYCRLQMPLRLALGVRGTVAGHRLGAPKGGDGVPPPLPILVCSRRRLLADRHSLPFPWTLSLRRRWCPSASHHPLTFLFLPALAVPLPFPFLSLGLSLRRPRCPSASHHSFPFPFPGVMPKPPSNASLAIRYRFQLKKEDFKVLQHYLSPVVVDSQTQGWEECTDAAMTHLLRTCLAKNARESGSLPQPLQVPPWPVLRAACHRHRGW